MIIIMPDIYVQIYIYTYHAWVRSGKDNNYGPSTSGDFSVLPYIFAYRLHSHISRTHNLDPILKDCWTLTSTILLPLIQVTPLVSGSLSDLKNATYMRRYGSAKWVCTKFVMQNMEKHQIPEKCLMWHKPTI